MDLLPLDRDGEHSVLPWFCGRILYVHLYDRERDDAEDSPSRGHRAKGVGHHAPVLIAVIVGKRMDGTAAGGCPQGKLLFAVGAVPLVGQSKALRLHQEPDVAPVAGLYILRFLGDGRCGGDEVQLHGPVDLARGVGHVALVGVVILVGGGCEAVGAFRRPVDEGPDAVGVDDVPAVGQELARGLHPESGRFVGQHLHGAGGAVDLRHRQHGDGDDVGGNGPRLIAHLAIELGLIHVVVGKVGIAGCAACAIRAHVRCAGRSLPRRLRVAAYIPLIGHVGAGGLQGHGGVFAGLHGHVHGLADDGRRHHHLQQGAFGGTAAGSVGDHAEIELHVHVADGGQGQGGFRRAVDLLGTVAQMLQIHIIPLVADAGTRGRHGEGGLLPLDHPQTLGLGGESRCPRRTNVGRGGQSAGPLGGALQSLVVVAVIASLGEGVALGRVAADGVEQEVIVVALVALVTVGHVHQIVAAVGHGHHVPHVGAGGAGIERDGACDAPAVDKSAAESGLVTQVLEGLGVALADHVGGGVAVEDPHQVPGALHAVEGIVVKGHRRVVVVVRQAADGFLVGVELLHVREILAGGDDG